MRRAAGPGSTISGLPGNCARSARKRGRTMVTAVPRPGSLAMFRVPPCISVNDLTRLRPSPVPLTLRVATAWTETKGSTIRSISASSMPMPVSRTVTAMLPGPANSELMVMRPPESVNLIALSIRLMKIWRNRTASPLMDGNGRSHRSTRSTPAREALRCSMTQAVSRIAPRSTSSISSSIAPTSIRATSSRSVMMACRWSPD